MVENAKTPAGSECKEASIEGVASPEGATAGNPWRGGMLKRRRLQRLCRRVVKVLEKFRKALSRDRLRKWGPALAAGSALALTPHVGPAGAKEYNPACTEPAFRAAIDAANSTAEADTILLPGSCTITIGSSTDEDANLDGDSDVLAAGGPLTIRGQGAATTVVDGGKRRGRR